MADINLGGLGVALITPFKTDLSIDYKALEFLIEHLINKGADYFVVLGTTGETPTLTDKEKEDVLNFVRKKVSGRIPLVAGIGGNNTLAVIDELKRRNLDGYQAILSVTPYYNKPSQEGIFQHYKAISDNSPLPIILYNVPGRTGVNISTLTIKRLLEETDKICGIKDASSDIESCIKIVSLTSGNFSLISGDDALTEPLMRIGAKGVISVLANAYPKPMKKIVDLCSAGNFKEASEEQDKIRIIISHLFAEGNPSGIKALLSKIGLVENVLRLPLVSVSKELEEKLIKEALFLNEIDD